MKFLQNIRKQTKRNKIENQDIRQDLMVETGCSNMVMCYVWMIVEDS
jgi:hypothetical protein